MWPPCCCVVAVWSGVTRGVRCSRLGCPSSSQRPPPQPSRIRMYFYSQLLGSRLYFLVFFIFFFRVCSCSFVSKYCFFASHFFGFQSNLCGHGSAKSGKRQRSWCISRNIARSTNNKVHFLLSFMLPRLARSEAVWLLANKCCVAAHVFGPAHPYCLAAIGRLCRDDVREVARPARHVLRT